MAATIVTVQAAYGQAAAVTPNTAFYRGDIEHSGYYPGTTPPVLSVAWQHILPDVKVAYSTPALVGGVLYLGAGKHVYAINEKDGTTKWQYPADGTAASGDFNCSPAVADGKVFIGSEDKNLSVFDASTGELLWQVPTGAAVECPPVVDNGTVFFGCNDSSIYAIKESDQKPLWGGQFRSDGPVFSAPIIDDGNLFFADANSNLYAIKESTGEKIWTYLPTSGVTPGGATFKNSIMYVVSGRTILGISARTGEIRSTFTVPSNINGPVTIANNSIYVAGSDQDIYCLNFHGTVLWHTRLQDICVVPLVVSDSYVYATSRRGVISALDSTTGNIVWSYALQNSIVHPSDLAKVTKDTLPQSRTDTAPLVQDGKLFVETNDGTLTEFSGKAPDHVAPVVLSVTPAPDAKISGANIQFGAIVTDTGSGINPSTVSLKVDGFTIPVYYDPSFSQVSIQFDRSKGSLGITRVLLPTLPDGLRTATLKLTDWRGNVVTKVWSFTVDNSNNPAGTAPASELPNDQATGAQGNTAGAAPLQGGQIAGGAGKAANGGGNGGNGIGGGPVVVNPGSTNQAGYTPAHPAPLPPVGTTGGGGGGTTGGVGFPPPPPI
jgi:outer membrane protein assembly factor BamB